MRLVRRLLLPTLSALVIAPVLAEGPPPMMGYDAPVSTPLQAALDARASRTTIHDITWDFQRDAKGRSAGDEAAFAALKAGYLGAREGDLDPAITRTPGEPGIASYFIGSGGRGPVSRAFAISQREDSKLILAGQIGTPGDPGGLPTRIAIAQLRANAALDASFGSVGVQTFEIANARLEVVDGFSLTETVHGAFWDRVYLLARDFELASGQNFALMCFRRSIEEQPFGPCPGFTNGIRYYAFGRAASCASDDSIPYGLHLDRSSSSANMSIYMVGSLRRTFNSCGDFDFGVVRVNMSGALDSSFNGNGTPTPGYVSYFTPQRTGGPPHIGAARAIAVLPDGGLMVGGGIGTGADEDALVLKLIENGDLDGSFCTVSNANCDSPAEYRSARRGFNVAGRGHVSALAAAPDGGVFVVRWSFSGGSQSLGYVQRVASDGACDIWCNLRSMLPVGGGSYRPVSAVWQPSSDGLAQTVTVAMWGHTATDPENSTAYLYRYRTAGSDLNTDTAFVTGGEVSWRQDISWRNSVTGGVRDARVSRIETDRQGRILVAAGVRAFGEERDMAMARLQGDTRTFRDGFE